MSKAAQLASSGTEPFPGDDLAGKYLIFRLGGEHFGVRISSLREVMEAQEVTHVPLSPPCIAGVINRRGSVIPVIDLRVKFGMRPEQRASANCILVVRITIAFVGVFLGIIVDEVLEVLSLDSSVIQRQPAPSSGISYLLGSANVNGKRKLLLDIDEVLGTLETQHLETLMQGG